jgi:uncharacterized membrane protein YgcG
MNRLRLLLAGISFLSILIAPTLASADVNDFVITSFDSDQTLSSRDPQGELHIIETIDVNFHDFNHGILRAIPKTYKSHSLQLHVNKITSTSGAPTHYTTYGSNGNTVLKIGDPGRTITGQQEYTIDYTVRNVITFYKDHDELFWDVNGDQWQQPFDSVNVTLHLPSDLKLQRNIICYTGSSGSTSQDCAVGGGPPYLVSTSKPLQPYQTLTYVAGFQKGYFSPHKWYDFILENLAVILKVIIPFALVGGGAFMLWYRKGRDSKGTGIIVPQYDAPEGLKPLATGTLADFTVDTQDVTSTIIDLAIRGYLKIIETKVDRPLLKDKTDYTLHIVNPDFSGLDKNEVTLMNALFSTPQAGETVTISQLKNKLYQTADSVRKSVEADLTDQGYFKRNPLTVGRNMLWLTVALAFFLYFFGRTLGWAIVIGLIAGTIPAYMFGLAMSARTAKGVAAKEHILGLKMYLETAEKDRIAKLQSPKAPYAANAAEPVKTVELYEKLLPYAMVLGVEKQWSRQFENLYTTPPGWYSGGNWSTFNSYYLASSLNEGFGRAVNTAFSPPSSSGGSGFGGGGGAGGGGGGGGGGGW